MSAGTSETAPPAEDSATQWFVRGTAVGMLLMAALNALSYFVRSRDWSSLVGPDYSTDEAIGFPWKVWESGNTYGGLYVDYPRLGLNVLFAIAAGSILGWLAVRRKDFLNGLMGNLQSDAEKAKTPPIQFTLRGLLIATTVVAVAATVARHFAARPETLFAIYALGPLALVALAMLPRHISWQKRVVIIIPATLTLIAVAIAVGTAMKMEFDKVLLGIFLCWTPQSALAAIALTVSILFHEARQQPSR